MFSIEFMEDDVTPEEQELNVLYLEGALARVNDEKEGVESDISDRDAVFKEGYRDRKHRKYPFS